MAGEDTLSGVGLAVAQAKLVELTWDAVAAFMPRSANGSPKSTPGREIREKVSLIARACVGFPSRAAPSSVFHVLDVGCGDGSVLDFLNSALEGSECDYTGIDLSSRMIEAAKCRPVRPGCTASFAQASLLPSVGSGGRTEYLSDEEWRRPRSYDCVLFNGSLQFFPDRVHALGLAEALLKPGLTPPPAAMALMA